MSDPMPAIRNIFGWPEDPEPEDFLTPNWFSWAYRQMEPDGFPTFSPQALNQLRSHMRAPDGRGTDDR